MVPSPQRIYRSASFAPAPPELLPRSSSYDHHHRSPSPSNGNGILDEIDKNAPNLRSFDAFPKVAPTYQTRTVRGGFITLAVCWAIFLLVLNDLGEYLYGEADYAFSVDHGIQKDIQLNVDLTVAMPCHFISIDLRDAVGDRVFLTRDFQKDGTTFDTTSSLIPFQSSLTGQASAVVRKADHSRTDPNYMIAQTTNKLALPVPTRPSGISNLLSYLNPFSKDPQKAARKHQQYRKTKTVVKDGPACRIYGSVEVKKVTANLHVTTLGHGYMSYEHTDHSLMNLSHIIHEFSFGPYYPSISQPLDMSLEVSDQHFSIFQYFLAVIPTRYITSNGKSVDTNQYSVTDYVRHVDHGKGVPGIFFKFDFDSLSLSIRDRTTTFYQFLIRLVGAIGGVWTCTSFAFRAIYRLEQELKRAKKGPGGVGLSRRGSRLDQGVLGGGRGGMF